MFKRIIAGVLLMLVCFSVFAIKPLKSERKQVDILLSNKNYTQAITQLRTLLVSYPQDPEFNFMLGVCYFHNSQNVNMAIDQFEKALKITKKKKLLIEIRYYLGRSYHIRNLFNKAIDNFNAIKDMISGRNKRMYDKVDRLIASSLYAKKMVANPVNIELSSLGNIINSKADDHSPCVSADERYMVFTSRRKGKYDEKSTDGQYYEDIYASRFDGYHWVTPVRIDAFSSPGHDASVSLSADGRTMLLFRSQKGDRSLSGGDIYIAYRLGDQWTEPEKLGGEINSSSRETHAAISPDGNTIYFSSDRPGGIGGLDIYYARKDKLGKWGEVKNLGKGINTKYDEQCPHMHIDGRSLYFSSNGWPTIGGLDIFMSTFIDGDWTEPKNLGYPINSLRDDVYFVPTADGKRAYFASARKGGKGGLDLYMLGMTDIPARKLFVIRGAVGDAEKDLSFGEYKIVVKIKGKEDKVYRPDPVNGEYLFIVDADAVYRVDYVREGYETMETIIEMPYSYYNDTNHGIIPLKRVKLRKRAGEYIASDFSADLPGSGFYGIKELPELDGKTAVLKILNLGSRSEDLPKVQFVSAVPVVSSVPVIKEMEYTVQVLAMTYDYPVVRFGSFSKNIDAIVGKDGIHRYIYKRYDTYNKAEEVMYEMRRAGYRDAFIREYMDGELGKSYCDCGPKKVVKKRHKKIIDQAERFLRAKRREASKVRIEILRK